MSENQQIGWSQEAILLRRISAQFSRLYRVIGNIEPPTISPLETDVTNSTVWNNGGGNIDSNTAFGMFAFQNNVSGTENVAFGYSNLYSNLTGNQNTISGYYAGFSDGIQNTAIGVEAFSSNIGANYNTGVGVYVLGGRGVTNPTGDYNTSIGMYSTYILSSGIGNTAFGGLAFQSRLNIALSGNYNIAYGYQAFRALSTGNNNIGILIEFQDGVLTGNRNIHIDSMNKPGSNYANNDSVVIGGLNANLTAFDGQVVIATGASNVRRLAFDTTGAATITVVPTLGSGGYSEKAMIIDAVSDANGMASLKTIDYSTSNTTTALLTKANLDAIYPSASIGFRVICILITATPKTYTKVSATAWCSESITNVA